MNIIYKSFSTVLIILCLGLGAFTQDRLRTESEIPILAWVGVPESETTLERFTELKASGININYSNYSNIEAVVKALNVANQAGVKLIPFCPELKSEPEKTVKLLMKHPALFGYHIRDEPHANDFPDLATWIKKIQAVDKQHQCYINLFPNYGKPERFFDKNHPLVVGKDIYEEYVDTFLGEVPVTLLSFDHYPVIEENGIRSLRSEWYQNLEIIASASKKSKLPFWAFARSVAYGRSPVPTIEEIRLQMYSNLAYGAQGLQYFTYWTPDVNPTWDFNHAPISLEGKRTEIYDQIKEVNQTIQHLSGVFQNANLIWVSHTGKRIPRGTRRITRLPDPIKLLDTGEGGAVVSLLEKQNRQFLIIVNRDFQNPMKLTMMADESVKIVLLDGSLVPSSAYAPVIEVDAGNMAIYTWEKNK